MFFSVGVQITPNSFKTKQHEKVQGSSLLALFDAITITPYHCLAKHISPKDTESRQYLLIYFMCLLLCCLFTKLHLLMRLRWGPSPASCSVSGIHLPACRHSITPGIKQRQRGEKKATANYVDLKEYDKATAMGGWQSTYLFYHELKDWQSHLCWQRKMPTAWWSQWCNPCFKYLKLKHNSSIISFPSISWGFTVSNFDTVTVSIPVF